MDFIKGFDFAIGMPHLRLLALTVIEPNCFTFSFARSGRHGRVFT